MRILHTLILFFYLVLPGKSQSPVILPVNPSLEGIPQAASLPIGWYFCGEVTETPPDLHPANLFQVNNEPHHGYSYVGMVVRDNNTWEAIGQQLAYPLLKDSCYQFSLNAARSLSYVSISRTTMQVANFDTPVVLRIWGGNQLCQHEELLAVSPPVEKEGWEEITFTIQPRDISVTHLIIEANYLAHTTAPYNGNVLIDDLQPIYLLNCQSGKRMLTPKALEKPLLPESQLEQYVSEQGQKIKLINMGKQLEMHLFMNEGQEMIRNKHLWQIGKALTQFPEKKIQIAIKLGDKTYGRLLLHHVERTLKETGLYEDQFKVKAMKRSDIKKDWLWKESLPQLLIRFK